MWLIILGVLVVLYVLSQSSKPADATGKTPGPAAESSWFSNLLGPSDPSAVPTSTPSNSTGAVAVVSNSTGSVSVVPAVVADSKSPVADAIPVVAPAAAAAGNSPVTAATIEIEKDSTGKSNPGDNNDWKSFQIAEIEVYDSSNNKLGKSAFASAFYNPEANQGWAFSYPAINAIDGNLTNFTHTGGQADVHRLTLSLASPTVISKVVVRNRVDCCGTRLSAATLRVRNSAGTVVKSATLSGDSVQTFTM